VKLVLNEHPHPHLAHIFCENLLLDSIHVYVFSENYALFLKNRRFFQEEKTLFSGSAKGKNLPPQKLKQTKTPGIFKN
jgi:hypothetical protein